MQKSKILETCLVLTTGFLMVFLVTSKPIFLYLAIFVALTGLFVKPLAKYIAVLWFKLADVLNYFISKIILGALFYLILFPISLMYRISNKDKLRLKKSGRSTWIERNKSYSSVDFENIW